MQCMMSKNVQSVCVFSAIVHEHPKREYFHVAYLGRLDCIVHFEIQLKATLWKLLRSSFSQSTRMYVHSGFICFVMFEDLQVHISAKLQDDSTYVGL